jgi:hypothetical protein
VTRFDLKTFPHGPVWGGRVAYAPGSDAQLATAFTDFKNNQSVNPETYDPYAAGWATFTYNGSANAVMPSAILWYTEPELKPGALKEITTLPSKIFDGMATGSVGTSARNASVQIKATHRR